MKKIFIFVLLFATAHTAWADAISFIERSWDPVSKQVVSTRKTWLDGEYQTITNHEGMLYLQANRYVVRGNVTVTSGITVNPTSGKSVEIVLADGAKLETKGIIFAENYYDLSLTIYAEENGGTLGRISSIAGSFDKRAGIGSREYSGGDVTIHGGDIYAYGREGFPGIGASYDGKNVTIYGGAIEAIGHTGIGGGDDVDDYGTISIYGGTVKATGEVGAGIGGGEYCERGMIHIYGGDVTAKSNDEAAGIGCGQWAPKDKGAAGHVIIDGGKVVARGGNYGAGIGGGDGIDGYIVEINGGEVYAYGGTDAAGIGGGEGGNGGTVTINGGRVEAYGGSEYGAGIGGGQDGDGGNVTINGGIVYAKAGKNDTGCRAIGPGHGSDNYGKLTLAGNLMVTSERTFNTEERRNACWYRTLVHIEPCVHASITYTIDGSTPMDYHTCHCNHCTSVWQEDHDFVSGVCTKCGVHQTAWFAKLFLPHPQLDDSYDGHTYFNFSSYVREPGTNFILPFCTVKVPNLQFVGWENVKQTISGRDYDSPYTTDTTTLYQVGDPYLMPASDCYFVARYRTIDLTLYDDASNGATLAEQDGQIVVHAKLSGRKFTKDNKWQTLALPFALSADQVITSPLKNATIKQLDLDGEYDGHKTGYDLPNNTLYLYFKDTTAIAAGKPYVFRWASGTDIVDPVFNNVTLTNQTADVRAPYFYFRSLYSPKSYSDERPNVVYLGANNTFKQPDGVETVTISSFRAYFQLMKLYTSGYNSAKPLIIVTNLDGAVVPTDIEDTIFKSSNLEIFKYLQNGLLFIERDGKLYNTNGTQIR